MRKSRFTEEQIIGILGEQERGVKTAEVCRKHGISPNTFYKWKSKFGGMDVSDARSGLIVSAVVGVNPPAERPGWEPALGPAKPDPGEPNIGLFLSPDPFIQDVTSR